MVSLDEGSVCCSLRKRTDWDFWERHFVSKRDAVLWGKFWAILCRWNEVWSSFVTQRNCPFFSDCSAKVRHSADLLCHTCCGWWKISYTYHICYWLYDLLHRYIGATLLENQLDRYDFPLRSEDTSNYTLCEKSAHEMGEKRSDKATLYARLSVKVIRCVIDNLRIWKSQGRSFSPGRQPKCSLKHLEK